MDKYLLLIQELEKKKKVVIDTLISFSIDVDNRQNSFNITGNVVTFSLDSKNRFIFNVNKEKIQEALKENNLILKN